MRAGPAVSFRDAMSMSKKYFFKPQSELNYSSKEDRDVRDVLVAWEQARRARAQVEMVETARTLGQRRFFQSPEGFGGYIGSNINAESFHYWGQREGYGCWNDKQFNHEYLRDNPYARVKNHARKLTLAVPELPSNKRERKTYATTGGGA